MKTRLFIYPLFLLFGYYTSYSQTTLGLLKHTSLVEDGYILMYPRGEKQTYLINNCGELVHEWLTLNTNGVSYILEDGSLLKSGQTKLEKFSWDNQLLWSADLQTFGIDQHHDIFDAV